MHMMHRELTWAGKMVRQCPL